MLRSKVGEQSYFAVGGYRYLILEMLRLVYASDHALHGAILTATNDPAKETVLSSTTCYVAFDSLSRVEKAAYATRAASLFEMLAIHLAAEAIVEERKAAEDAALVHSAFNRNLDRVFIEGVADDLEKLEKEPQKIVLEDEDDCED